MSSVRSEREVCFVVSPIGESGSEIRKRADKFIKFVVLPSIGDLYTVVRADQIASPGSINRQVFERLLNDDLVIADLTGHNPNVYYELAVRHCFAKPYVQMIHAADKIPFDLLDQRTIKFDIADLESVQSAIEDLRALALATRTPGFNVVTPIGEAVKAIESANYANGMREIRELLERQLSEHGARLVDLIRRSLPNYSAPPVPPPPSPVPSQSGQTLAYGGPPQPLPSGERLCVVCGTLLGKGDEVGLADVSWLQRPANITNEGHVRCIQSLVTARYRNPECPLRYDEAGHCVVRA